MSLKTKIFIVLLLIFLITLSFLGYRASKIEEETIKLSKNFSDEFIKLFEIESEPNFEMLRFSSEGKNDLEKIIGDLIERDNLEIVIATEKELEELSSENLGASPSISNTDSDEDLINDNNIQQNENNVISKESNVFKEDDKYKIKVSDLKMHTPEYALINFLGGDFKIYKNEIPETYSMILKNPRYSYVVKKIEMVSNKGFIDKRINVKVFIHSMYDNHLKIIKLGLSGNDRENIKIESVKFDF